MDSGQYQPKVVRCRLKTAGKTVYEIRDSFKGQGLVYRDFENIQKGGDLFGGLELLLSVKTLEGRKFYSLHGWKKDIDEKVMMAMFYFEQAHPFPCYKGELDKFVADWKSGKYDPSAEFVFLPEDVQELEVVQEESGVITYAKEEKPTPPQKIPRRKKKKSRRRK